MISERVLSRSFLGFWAELLPLLTPSFVHMFNEAYRRMLIDELGHHGEPVEKASDISDSAFVAEVAFYIAKLAAQRATSVIVACEDTALVANAVHLATATVSAYETPARRDVPGELSDSEYHEILNLARNYDIFFRARATGNPVIFNPRIPGTGFIASCEADIAIDNTLYEVKTITRNIASKDIRQLIIYLALQAATGERLWTKAGFFNPRKAILHEFSVDDLVSRMSGGRFAVEVFREIVVFSLSRDIDTDTVF